MPGRRVSGNPEEKTELCRGRMVWQPTSPRGRRVRFHLRVGPEGGLMPTVSAESHRAEEASPGPGGP